MILKPPPLSGYMCGHMTMRRVRSTVYLYPYLMSTSTCSHLTLFPLSLTVRKRAQSSLFNPIIHTITMAAVGPNYRGINRGVGGRGRGRGGGGVGRGGGR